MSFSILFVDDDPFILSALRRLLRGYCRDWVVAFAESGKEALELMRESPRDVVVTDMRMPGIDGGALLNQVRSEFPRAVRIVLSGQSKQEDVFRAIGPAHQYLCKPCDPDTLKDAVIRACTLRDHFEDPALSTLISQIDSLPSLPQVYQDLFAELHASDISLTRIGHLIKQDLAMTAKILQLVNSSFFGSRQRISDPVQAVTWLGMNHVRPLVLTAGIFSQVDQLAVEGFSFDSLINHSLAVATCARSIAEDGGGGAQDMDDAFLAGMLHDIGKLVFAVRLPDRYQRAMDLARSAPLTMWEAEREEFGASHAAVGAYLLSLWGLPSPVTEAIAFHHEPQLTGVREFTPLYAVHVANALRNSEFPVEERGAATAIDPEYLQTLPLRSSSDVKKNAAMKPVEA